MEQRKVLITGASRGIGWAIAQKLSGQYPLILHASREDSFTAQLPNSEILCADFSDTEQVKSFCSTLRKKYGDCLYAVINNAAVTLDNGILFQPERDIDKIIQVNLKAPIMLSKAALKVFTQQKQGVIINMSSIVAHTGNAFQSVYAATKSGLLAFSKSLAQEVGALNEEHQIRVLSVSPGFIETDMTAKMPETDKQKFLHRVPLNRLGKPDDIANLISFLLSDEAAYINGSTMDINGGLF
jgi:3-oxoacyl-[acyl-carrier protein] reductase